MDCQDQFLVLYTMLASGRARDNPRAYLFELSQSQKCGTKWRYDKVATFLGADTTKRIEKRVPLCRVDEIRAAYAVVLFEEEHRAAWWNELTPDNMLRAAWRNVFN